MKTRVLKDDYREIEIRPAEEFNKYLSLIKNDIKNIFESSAGNYFEYCPACTTDKTNFNLINPCGVTNKLVTTLSDYVKDIDIEKVKDQVIANFGKVFKITLENMVLGPMKPPMGHRR